MAISGTRALEDEGRFASAASGLTNGSRPPRQSRTVGPIASREKPAPWALDFKHSPDHSGAVGRWRLACES